MKAVLAGLATLALATASAPISDKPFQVAAVCVKTGEMVAGNNKTCFYNCSGAGQQVTVPVGTLCPLTISK